MKKLNLFLAVFLTFFISNLNGQIKQDCNGNVGIGETTDFYAKLNIEPVFSGPGKTNLLIGNWYGSGGCLTLGVHNDYSWIESYHGKPLYINYEGNDVIFCNHFSWGDVGIGYNITNPSAKLHVNGAIYATGTITSSDIRLKKNINKFSMTKDIKEKINKLESITYDWDVNKDTETKKDSLSKIDREFFQKKQYGFSAQEVQKIFPELVYEDNSGMLGINYQAFIPILFEMIKEQKDVIDQLNEKIEVIQNDCCSSSNLKSASISTGVEENSLYQNTPNPFSVSTTIRYSLSQNVNNAMINIYNMNGMQLKSISLHHKRDGNVTINGGEFKAGMYLYSLIADGQIIDTKRMVLTD